MPIETFTVDTDNPQDIIRVTKRLNLIRHVLMRNLGHENVTMHGNNYSMKKMMPMMEDILDSDISALYPDLDDTKRDYYVYAHCDPMSIIKLKDSPDLRLLAVCMRFPQMRFMPFYIGKGCGDRSEQLNRNEGHRKIRTRILAAKTDIDVVKLAENLTEREALSLESKLIDILGLKLLSKKAFLVNLDEGAHPIARRCLYGENKFLTQFLKRNGFKDNPGLRAKTNFKRRRQATIATLNTNTNLGVTL
jgi:hypothetical protein